MQKLKHTIMRLMDNSDMLLLFVVFAFTVAATSGITLVLLPAWAGYQLYIEAKKCKEMVK